MMKIITLANQKGGVAKTTTAIALATILHNQGRRVLGVDLDPQSNFAFACGVDVMNQGATLYHVFHNQAAAPEAVTNTEIGFDIMPGGLALASADMELTQTGREYLLKEALKAVENEYDYAIVDTPPTVGILTINALTASDVVIIPMNADVYSVQGLSQLNFQIGKVQQYTNQRLKIGGLLLTKYNDRQNVTKVARDLIEAASKQIETNVFKTTIREAVAVREAALMKNDMFKEAPNSNAAVDYTAFVNELFETGVL